MLVNDYERFLKKIKIGTAFGVYKMSLYQDLP